MTQQATGSHAKWLVARFELLEAESHLGRDGDELAQLARLDSLWGVYQLLERILDGLGNARLMHAKDTAFHHGATYHD